MKNVFLFYNYIIAIISVVLIIILFNYYHHIHCFHHYILYLTQAYSLLYFDMTHFHSLATPHHSNSS